MHDGLYIYMLSVSQTISLCNNRKAQARSFSLVSSGYIYSHSFLPGENASFIDFRDERDLFTREKIG
jgi:hypothetical protein